MNHCGNCPYTDGCCYTTIPPKVKCTITDKFHYYDDVCDCEEQRMLKVVQDIKVTIERSDDCSTCGVIKVDDTNKISPIAQYTECMVCGMLIELSLYETGPKMCNECKRAVRFIKEKFREELYTL